MIARIGEARQERMSSGTYDGIFVNIYMVAAALNTQLVPGDCSPAQISVKVLLKRNKETHTIMQDNLLVLATYWNLNFNYHEFLNGVDKTLGDASTRACKLRLAKIPFGGPIRIEQNDEIIVEVLPAQIGAFSANVDVSQSYVEFYANPCIGYEEYLPMTSSEVVTANISKQPFNPGDNIARLMFLNFDKNDFTQEVISNITVASDKLDLSLSLNQLIAHSANKFGGHINTRYGTSLPIPANGNSVVRGLNYLPQSFLLHQMGHAGAVELDQVKVDISFNAQNVNSSQNYLVYTRFIQSARQVIDASEREAKHRKEAFQKIKSNPVNV